MIPRAPPGFFAARIGRWICIGAMLPQPVAAMISSSVATAFIEPGEKRCVLLSGSEANAVVVAPSAEQPGVLVLNEDFAFELRSDSEPDRWSARNLELRDARLNALHPVPPGNAIKGRLSVDRNRDQCELSVTLRADRAATDDDVRRARSLAQGIAALGSARALLRIDNKPRDAYAAARSGRDAAARELGETHTLVGHYEALLGSSLWQDGDFTGAFRHHERAAEIFEKTGGEDSYAALAARANAGLDQHELGAFATARDIYERTYARVAALHGSESATAGMIESNLATLLHEMGLYEEAIRRESAIYAKRSETLGPSHSNTLISLNNLAALYASVGRDDEALDLYREAFERYKASLGERHPDTLRTQQNLATNLCLLRKDREGCELLARTVETRKNVLGEDHPEVLISRSNYAIVLARSGRMDEALKEVEAVLAVRRAKLGATHTETLRSLSQVGQIRLTSGQQEEGIALLEQAISGADQALGRLHLEAIEFVAAEARACRLAKHAICERRALDDLVERVEALRDALPAGQDQRIGVFASWAPYYRRLAGLQATADQTLAALATIERSKARSLLEHITLRQAEGKGILPADDVARLQALAAEIAALSTARRSTTDSTRIAALETREQSLLADLAAERNALRTKYPRYAAASRIEIVGASEAQRLLRPTDLLLNYAFVGNELLLFAIDRTRVTVSRIPARNWSELIIAWRASALRADGADKAGPFGAALSAALLEPVAARLRGVRRLIVSPDGPLAVLAFEALPWEGGRLAERFDVSYAQSMSVYAQLVRRPPGKGAAGSSSLFAMGAPDFAPAHAKDGKAAAVGEVRTAPVSTTTLRSLGSAQASDRLAVGRAYDLLQMHWEPLPGALKEIEGVRRIFRSTVSFTGAQATEDKLIELNQRGELARYRYLLFATHGYLSPSVPSLSAIVLSQPGSKTADGYVTAAEWPGYRLNSELVVLSACESGLGKDVTGEGVMGLPFALFAAGNRATVMSLWKVPDESTARFMLEFFRRLQAGAPPVTALAQTKRVFMRDARHAGPLHWAGFVLYGP